MRFMFQKSSLLIKPIFYGSLLGIASAFFLDQGSSLRNKKLNTFPFPSSFITWSEGKDKPNLHNHLDESRLKNFRPDAEKFERIDHLIFKDDPLSKDDHPLHSHVLYSSLLGESKVECYEIYRSKSGTEEEIYCVIAFGDKLNGWPNIVHGGMSQIRPPSIQKINILFY
jgi:hypothetical protein